MKLYVAGPMTGIPGLNYPAFRVAAQRLGSMGYETLNPVDIDMLQENFVQQAWDWYMRHALRMVLEADGIALLDGWETSKGAQLEVTVATALGLPVKRLEEW